MGVKGIDEEENFIHPFPSPSPEGRENRREVFALLILVLQKDIQTDYRVDFTY